MTKSDAKLETCPFCGKRAVLFIEHRQNGSAYWLECSGCYMRTAKHKTARTVIEYWNRRKT